MAGHIDMQAQWVQAKFYFEVFFDGVQLSFQEVTGLEFTNEVIEYRHGDSPEFVTQKRIGMSKTPELTFKKGVFEADSHLLDHMNEVHDKHFMTTEAGRRDLEIHLLDENGAPVMVWNVRNFIPTKLGGVSLKSDSNEAAIEEMTGVCEMITVALG